MPRFLLWFSFLIMAACGFHPVYGVNKHRDAGVETHLAQVEIANIPDRDGQYLRNALIDRFYRGGVPDAPLYSLDVEPVNERLIDLDITKTADTTRGQLKLDTEFVLRDAKTQNILLRRNIRAVTSYNILGSEFATRVTESAARDNALDDLARQIETHVTLRLRTGG